MDSRIEMIYDVIKYIKNEMVRKDLIKKVIKEIDHARREIQHWKEVELGSLVKHIMNNEIGKIDDTMLKMGVNDQEVREKRSYSEAVESGSINYQAAGRKEKQPK